MRIKCPLLCCAVVIITSTSWWCYYHLICFSCSYLLLTLYFILCFLLTVVSLGMCFASLLCWLYECVYCLFLAFRLKENLLFLASCYSDASIQKKKRNPASNHFINHWIKDGFLFVNYLTLIMLGEAKVWDPVVCLLWYREPFVDFELSLVCSLKVVCFLCKFKTVSRRLPIQSGV